MYKLSAGVANSKQGFDKVNITLQGVQKGIKSLVAQRPDLASDPNFQKAYGTIKGLQPNVGGISSGFGQVQGGFSSAQSGLGQAGNGLTQIKGGINRSNIALGQIQPGLKTMRSSQLKTGEDLIAASSGLNQITSGFGTSKAALLKMGSGVEQARERTDGYTSSGNHIDEVFYLPSGTLERYPQLRNAMDTFIIRSLLVPAIAVKVGELNTF
ncbi:MAG: hypothetical protein IBX64_12195 [Actinobacteria bacterium]|nr:hypothetical protein [Actinomycetota bacterium]